jgi:histone-lysine N-methyltransferase ASH1L
VKCFGRPAPATPFLPTTICRNPRITTTTSRTLYQFVVFVALRCSASYEVARRFAKGASRHFCRLTTSSVANLKEANRLAVGGSALSTTLHISRFHDTTICHAIFDFYHNAMLSTILAGMGATPKASSRLEATRASPARSASSIITGEIDAASDPQSVSSSSTPPTSIGDEASISSTTLKAELVASAPSTPAVEGRARSQRERKSVATYNVKVLTGTAVHAPRKYCKNPDGTPVDVTKTVRRRTISGDTLVGASKSANASTASLVKDNDRLVRDGIDALDLQWSVKKLPRSKSQIGLAGDAKKPVKSSPLKRSKSLYTKSAVQKITDKFGTGKRRGGAIEEDIASGATRFKRELRKLQDTPEFAKIETEPIFHEVWSNGKLVQEERPRKKKKVEDAPQVQEPEPVEKNVNVKKEKTWQSKGLFAGQSGFENIYEKMPKGTAKPDDYGLAEMKTTTRSILPLPQGAGQRTLHVGRDFKLPFDICSPLPPGQPKPDEWRKTSSSKCVEICN